jgi:hypothetical protein
MQPRRYIASSAALLLTLMASAGAVMAQSGRTWVDPPGDTRAAPNPPAAPTPAAPPAAKPGLEGQSALPDKPLSGELPPKAEAAQAKPPAESAKPRDVAQPRSPDDNQAASRDKTAQAFVTDYLASWSATNSETLAATSDYYADRVLFHGRNMSLGRLMKEKQRFVRRWPERDYRPQPDSLKVTCDPEGRFCTVHTVFDFAAENPRRRRRTEGVAALQVIVSFADGAPVIVAENSVVLEQGRRRRNLALEGASR